MIDSRADFRLAIAKREAPRALMWTGLLILGLSLFTTVIEGRGLRLGLILHTGSVLIFLVCAWLTSRPGFPARGVPWAIVASAYSIIVALQVEVILDPTALGMAYVLLAMLAFGPFTLDFRAMAVVTVPIALGFVFAARAWSPDSTLPWLGAALAALAMGAVLLRVRIRSFSALYDLTEENRHLATRDPLTGALNRRGVEDRLTELVAIGRRQEQSVSVTFLDINGLKAANDSHGHAFGDTVIVAVANALRGLVREADVIGRWGGDEFIVVGLGDPVDPTHLEQRLSARFADAGVDVARWPDGVSIGSATMASAGGDITALIAAADADMYRRRLQRRG